MYKLSLIDKISIVFITIGAINCGLIGIFNFNLINFLFRIIPLLERFIYTLIGLSAINALLFMRKSKI